MTMDMPKNVDIAINLLQSAGFEAYAVGGMDKLFDEKRKAYEQQLIKYLAHDEDKEEKLFEHPELFKTPIVRNGKQATVGNCQEKWKDWE